VRGLPDNPRERILFMLKKTAIIVLLIFILGTTFVLALPTDRGLGQKVCWAGHLFADRARNWVDPHPVPALPDAVPETGSAVAGASRVPVLMYHAVIPAAENPDPNNGSIINLETFEQHMAHLHDEGYYAASLEELELYVHGIIGLPEKTVVITFDDGYENNYTHAYPVLERYGLRASLFVIGTFIREDGERPKPGMPVYLSKGQMEEMSSVFDYHSHTHNLHRKEEKYCAKPIPATDDPEVLAADIAVMKSLGFDTPYFAYPYGYFTHDMVGTLIENGYRMAFTTREGFVQPGDHPMYLPRIGLRSDSDLSEALQ
jgi:peptidoglycan/xylan/chitin deacetylase (PgdA/CDA1 family)